MKIHSIISKSFIFCVLIGCQRNEFSIKQCSNEQRQALQEAANEWCLVTIGRACPLLVDDSAPNTITCYMDYPKGCEGLTSIGYGMTGTHISVYVGDGVNVTHDIALHEFGHWVAQEPGHLRPNALAIMTPIRNISVHNLTKLDLQWYCFYQGCRVQNGQIVW